MNDKEKIAALAEQLKSSESRAQKLEVLLADKGLEVEEEKAKRVALEKNSDEYLLRRINATELELKKQVSAWFKMKDEHDTLRAENEGLRKQRDDEAWMHAACLSVAEGVPDWDKVKDPSPVIMAVQKLRGDFEGLRRALVAILQYPGLERYIGSLLFRAGCDALASGPESKESRPDAAPKED